MRIAIITDRGRVSRWQAHALADLARDHEFVIYDCINGRPAPRKATHAFYYALNLVTIRNPLTRSAQIAEVIPAGSPIVPFACEYEGNWQRLPESLLARITEDAPGAILKFGMNLLRVPERDVLAVPILSYHHGDPDRFRGRPAGFYELVHGAPAMGQIVQILSNRLDAGAVVAFAETKAHPHSYRATLMEAYRLSPLLLRKAIDNAVAGRTIAKESRGRNYRLPGNAVVAGFAARRALHAVQRTLYGALLEKRWQVTRLQLEPSAVADGDVVLARAHGSSIACPNGYRFIADPFFASDGSLLVEGLDRGTGKGAILKVGASSAIPLTDPRRHSSYPGTLIENGKSLVMPETAQWSDPTLFALDGEALVLARTLDIAGKPRLLDPTLFRREGRYYLFGNVASEGANILRLWSSDALDGHFAEHPDSPVRMSPRGSRMAGAIVAAGDRLLRFGQDFSFSYGDGIVTFRVTALDADSYREEEVGSIRCADARGPHTLNFRNGEAVFDWYRNRFAPLAGVRRLAARRR